MIAVGKTADLEGSKLAQFGTRIDNLSHHMPVAATQLLDIAQAAGQLGVKGEENIMRFTETVARMGSSTNLSGSEAATTLARLLNVTRESMGSVGTLGSVLVALGNNFATTEAEIAHTANEVARATSVFGVSSANASALAAAMSSMGIQAELGGSSVGKAMRKMDEAIREGGDGLKRLEELTGLTGEQLKKTFAEDATKAFQLFLQGVGRVIDSGGSATETLEEFNLKGEEIEKTLPVLAQNADEVGRAIDTAAREVKNATALVTESDKAFESFNSEMQLLRNTITSIAVAIGAELAPRLEILSRGVRWALNGGSFGLEPGKSEARIDDDVMQGINNYSEFKTGIDDDVMQLLNQATDFRQGDPVPTPAPKKRGTNDESADDSVVAASAATKGRLLTLEKQLQRELLDAKFSGSEKIIEEHRRMLAELEKIRNPKNTAQVDAMKEQALELRDAKLAKYAAKESERESKAAKNRRDENAKLIADLQQEAAAISMTDQQRYVSTALRRLSATATKEQRQEVEKLATVMYSEQEAVKQLKKAAEDHEKLLERGKEVTKSVATEEEKRAAVVAELNTLLKEGAIDQETYTRAMMASATDWSSGMQRALRAYSDDATNSAKNWEIATSNAFRGMEDALTSFVATGKADWKSLVDSILADLARIAVRESITGPLAKALGMSMGGSSSGAAGSGFGFGDVFEGIGSLFSSIFHDGGIVGDGAISRRSVPSQIFVGAPRFHSGGIIGPDEVPIIAQRGERVLSRKQNKAYEAGQTGAGDNGRVEVQIINVTNPDMIKRLVADTIVEKKDTVVNMVLNAMDERNLVVRRF
ncbi:MAG: phage tail tape measure protein [Nitrospirae bacterium]|nr:phage tail tape measure protein [Magnetococcales bacterium]